MKGRHFLRIADWTRDELEYVLDKPRPPAERTPIPITSGSSSSIPARRRSAS